MSEELGCHNVVIEGENRELEVPIGELEGEKGSQQVRVERVRGRTGHRHR